MTDVPKEPTATEPPGAAVASGARRLDAQELEALLAQVRTLRPPRAVVPRRLLLAAVFALLLLGLLAAVSFLALRTATKPSTPTTPFVPPSTAAHQGLAPARGGTPPVATAMAPAGWSPTPWRTATASRS